MSYKAEDKSNLIVDSDSYSVKLSNALNGFRLTLTESHLQVQSTITVPALSFYARNQIYREKKTPLLVFLEEDGWQEKKLAEGWRGD